MSDRTETMNLKLNNDIKGSVTTEKSSDSLVKEERRRTGRYMAILVGISLFILALYHAWVRRIPIVASLVVPALIMFVYVAWILYTASREKHRFRLFDVEVGQTAPEEGGGDIAITELTQNNADTSVASNKENETNCTEDITNWTNISTALMKGDKNIHADIEHNRLPIILVNDKPPEDLDQKWLNIVELSNNDKLRVFHTRRKYKRRFCRSRRHAAFKRSYSIG
ncbi:uncharacterized protein LOC124631482 isoform X2 [Helicoverpa zea]|uniref:uncharacterized protein LOC124631482 isoform X2 n=1 Tax=Helicoverpa zea TaxID=7113 RepID=UPI001F55F3B1|nr:uncharacterized protein LOC124631482 isoform X2 [Helicoverpa zea]